MMRWFYVARAGVRSLFARRVFDEQLDADLQFHLEQATAEYIREGMSPDQARRAALKAFGNPADVSEDVRETSMWIWWERLAQDLRYGLRGFRRSPAFTATAVLSLALGIGATTAIFSIFNTLVLRPLPVRDPATLFQVLHRGDAGASESSTYALYEYLKIHAQTIAGTFQVDPTSTMRVLVDGQADAIIGQLVTGDYFNVLGIRPVIGNVIEPRGDPGSTPNRGVVLGDAYWARRFGRDPGVLGRTMTIDEVPHTIIGVTPPEFFGLQVGRRADVSIPLDGSEEPNFWKVESPGGASRAGRLARDSHRRPERRVSAVSRQRQDPVGPSSGPGVQGAGPCPGVIRPVRIPRSVRQTGAGDAGNRLRAPRDRMRQSRESLPRTRGRTAAGSLGVLGVRREPNTVGAPDSLGNPLDLDGRWSARRPRRLVGHRCAGRIPTGRRYGDPPGDWSRQECPAVRPVRDVGDRIVHRSGPGLARPQSRSPEHAVGRRTNRGVRRRRVQNVHHGAGRAVDGARSSCHALRGHVDQFEDTVAGIRR